jgi:epoxyqueuosine reductase
MKFPMPNENRFLRSIDEVWRGNSTYKQGLSVPEINIKYGSLISKAKTLPSYARYLVGSLVELNRSVRSIRHNPYTGNKTATPELLAELANFCRSRGVSDIGYAQVNASHLFKDSIVLYKQAIVLTMEMSKAEIVKAPSKPTNTEVFRTYYELGRTVNQIATFLREKGYNAQAIPAISSNLNLTVLARDAGLGEFGKHGLLITKALGPSVRLAAVLTDLDNLPFTTQQGTAWIKTFCDSCNVCVRKCPAQAIHETPIVFEDGSERHIDYTKCAVPFTKQHGCTICIKECTFFKVDYEKIEKAVIRSET